MGPETTNTEAGNNIGAKPADIKTAITDPTPAPAAFPPPKVLEAIVDPNEKPKEGPTAFSFTNPKELHGNISQPTKGDANPPAGSAAAPTKTLAQLDAEIAKDERANEELGYDDYKDSAEMFIDMYSGALTFIARLISKDSSDSAYEFPKPKEDKLKGQLIKVLRKRRIAMPIEALFIGTLIPATAQIIVKATDRRKEFLKTVKKDPPAAASEPAPASPGKRRGPGRPSK